MWGVIVIGYSTINTLRAQDIEIGHWLWAGQSPTDVGASQSRLMDRCSELELTCRHSNLKILVRSWTGGEASVSIKHHTPRVLSKGASVILSYRLEYLVNDKEVGAIIRRDINIWRRAGRPVTGIEIDFDSPSTRLEGYRKWLVRIQGQLPDDISLNITGLPSWFEDDRKGAKKLARSVREVSLMFYRQEQTPITQHLLAAINNIQNLRYAFLCDDMRWKALIRETEKNETFRMAIFLISRCNDVGKSAPS
ncbi:DUF3142 domain-containing protein [Kiloniella sp.]|uniref:DUF3142 domain-containing protein n=1 Tax=Kiloniella sp. TaxID=1938587 RepID=UPI003B014A21